ncbi:MAG TPA: EamA family transporter, partial [Chloroflexota bacterium]|nr:EamA family transporter [Chloroflexota bacterium]
AGATRAALITYVNPAVAVVLGAIVLSEPITIATVAGFVLILIGCWLSSGGALPERATTRSAVRETA